MRKSATFAALALTVTAMSMSPALAGGDDARCAAPGGRWIGNADVRDKVAAMGLNVRRVKTEGSCYEIYATDRNGARVELYVHPVTGNVVKTRDRS